LLTSAFQLGTSASRLGTSAFQLGATPFYILNIYTNIILNQLK
jgi:hypothetical protein